MGAAPIFFPKVPADVINQAIDGLGEGAKIIGDINDGSLVSETARRGYGQILRQLLRAAHWNFARRQATLTLLADSTGQSAPPIVTLVEFPWTYAYAWPLDGVQGRWMPAGYPPGSGSQLPLQGAQLTGGIAVPQIPGRFLVSSTNLYPIEVGSPASWDQLPDLSRTEGLGPTFRKVILTDICNACFVYTRLVTSIEEWDPAFRQAMVSCLQIVLAPVAIEDKKRAIEERDKALGMAKVTLDNARLANGNEAGWPQTTDHQPAWITGRTRGWWGSASGGVGGQLYGGGAGSFMGWDSVSLGGSVF